MHNIYVYCAEAADNTIQEVAIANSTVRWRPYNDPLQLNYRDKLNFVEIITSLNSLLVRDALWSNGAL